MKGKQKKEEKVIKEEEAKKTLKNSIEKTHGNGNCFSKSLKQYFRLQYPNDRDDIMYKFSEEELRKYLSQLASNNITDLEGQNFEDLQDNTRNNWANNDMDELITNAPTLSSRNIIIINLHETEKERQITQNLNLFLLKKIKI